MLTLTLAAALFLSAAMACPEYVPVPLKYHMKRNKFAGPSDEQPYVAFLCGHFDGMTATVHLNMPVAEWNPEKGDYLIAQVFSGVTHKQIIDNGVWPKLREEFSFVYNKAKYGNLFFHITTGRSSTFTYTFNVEFSTPKTAPPSCEAAPDARYSVNDEDMMEFYQMQKRSHIRSRGGKEIETLVQDFKLTTDGQVGTYNLTRFQMDYCFVHDAPYEIVVSVVATDPTSGFNTFVCLGAEGRAAPCTVQTNYVDLTGSGANFVVLKNITSKRFGPVRAIVKGNGRFKQKNNFIIAGSRAVHDGTTEHPWRH